MSGQDYPDPAPEAAESPLARLGQAKLSRRSVLRRGGVVGAVGLAVAAGGGGAAAALLSSQSKGNAASTGTGTGTAAAAAQGSGPIVIYMADPQSGEMEIFAGTGRTRHNNRAMASMVASMAPH
jgi:hypothetical protein